MTAEMADIKRFISLWSWSVSQVAMMIRMIDSACNLPVGFYS